MMVLVYPHCAVLGQAIFDDAADGPGIEPGARPSLRLPTTPTIQLHTSLVKPGGHFLIDAGQEPEATLAEPPGARILPIIHPGGFKVALSALT